MKNTGARCNRADLPDDIGRPVTPAKCASAAPWALDSIGPNCPIGRQQRSTTGRERLIGPALKVAWVSWAPDRLDRPIGSGLASFPRFLAPIAKSSALLLLKGLEKCPRDSASTLSNPV